MPCDVCDSIKVITDDMVYRNGNICIMKRSDTHYDIIPTFHSAIAETLTSASTMASIGRAIIDIIERLSCVEAEAVIRWSYNDSQGHAIISVKVKVLPS